MIKQKGFTLVEFSVVLVILGLITAGVSGGLLLVKTAKLQSVITDVNNYKTAINTFQAKYKQLPGDFNNANAYWPSITNGDNSGYVHYLTESLRVWESLYLAGLISGNFDSTGTQSQASPHAKTGGYFTLWGNGPSIGNPSYGCLKSKNILQFGTDASGGYSDTPNLSVQDTEYIDDKMDDGKPFTGIMGIRTSEAPNCYDGSICDSTAVYNLDYSGLACAPSFAAQ